MQKFKNTTMVDFFEIILKVDFEITWVLERPFYENFPYFDFSVSIHFYGNSFFKLNWNNFSYIVLLLWISYLKWKWINRISFYIFCKEISYLPFTKGAIIDCLTSNHFKIERKKSQSLYQNILSFDFGRRHSRVIFLETSLLDTVTAHINKRRLRLQPGGNRVQDSCA